VTIGFFEATKITRQTLVMNLSKLLYSFGLRKKIIASVKNEGTNWNAMISTLMFVVSYDIMGLKFQWKLLWTCFFQGMLIWDYQGESLQRHEICIN
jgi:hypothetical protein